MIKISLINTRKANNYILALLFIVFFTGNIRAQVSGISASKLATINAISVTKNNIEFEPSFQFNYASKRYNNLKGMENIYPNKDSVVVNSCMNFRFTYGINERWEVGMMVPSDVGGFSIGTKYLLGSYKNISMSGIAGLNAATNSVICKINPSYDDALKLAGGLAFTWQLSETISIDMDHQFQRALNLTREEHQYDYFLNIDAGYFIHKYLQAVIGINYYQSQFIESSFNSSLLVVNPGITIEPAEKFLMVINIPRSIFGKNQSVLSGFAFALTIMLD